jgi:predicted unusual protein kinase regulating ubiquinone biosynthesis (AarF/ABC1/UbiB family)
MAAVNQNLKRIDCEPVKRGDNMTKISAKVIEEMAKIVRPDWDYWTIYNVFGASLQKKKLSKKQLDEVIQRVIKAVEKNNK